MIPNLVKGFAKHTSEHRLLDFLTSARQGASALTVTQINNEFYVTVSQHYDERVFFGSLNF